LVRQYFGGTIHVLRQKLQMVITFSLFLDKVGIDRSTLYRLDQFEPAVAYLGDGNLFWIILKPP
jgi:hypothetical protein